MAFTLHLYIAPSAVVGVCLLCPDVTPFACCPGPVLVIFCLFLVSAVVCFSFYSVNLIAVNS